MRHSTSTTDQRQSGPVAAPISRPGSRALRTRLSEAFRPAHIRNAARLALASLSSLLLFALLAAPGVASAATVPWGDRGPCLCSSRTLQPGQYLLSQNGAYQLVMQNDGNLVVYAGTQPLWDSQTWNNPGAYAVLQPSDGNLVVYSTSGKALWSAYVLNAPGDELQMQNDGNLVVYSAAGSPLWATMTFLPATHGATLTVNPGGSGQCTWWAEHMFAGYTGAYINTLGIHGTTGDARYWGYNASQRGWNVGSTPRIGSIVVFQPGSGISSVGHVAWVTQVYPATNSIVISEMNYKGLGVVDSRGISPAFGASGLQYIYVNP
jgi:surface antigen